MLLTKEKIDAYKDAGLTQISLSMNAFNKEKASELAHHPSYNIEKIKDIAKYAAKKLKLVLTPVYLKKLNQDEIESIIKFAKEINAEVSIQNFLRNRRGRNPTSTLNFKKFYKILGELEKKYDIKLLKVDKLIKTNPLPKVAKKGQVIEANVCLESKFEDEKIAIYENKCIIVYNVKKLGPQKIKIIKASHNFYYAKALN